MSTYIRLLLIAVLSLPTFLVQADDSPSFDEVSGTLQLPAVDGADTAAVYQDVTFRYLGWNIWLMQIARIAQQLDVIEQVRLVMAGSEPEQVFLEITGTFPNNCSAPGRRGIRQQDMHFEVRLYYDYARRYLVCTQVLTPFREVIPLPVYGLDAGTYEYTLNGEFSGNFTLDTLNVLP